MDRRWLGETCETCLYRRNNLCKRRSARTCGCEEGAFSSGYVKWPRFTLKPSEYDACAEWEPKDDYGTDEPFFATSR